MSATNVLAAHRLCKAIQDLAKCPEKLNILENYLGEHFDEWLKTYADTPDKIAYEFENFANFEIKL